METPLAPFQVPAFLPNTISVHQATGWLLAAVLLFWAVYALIAFYHWARYSHAPLLGTLALGVHAVVSLILILFAVSGLGVSV